MILMFLLLISSSIFADTISLSNILEQSLAKHPSIIAASKHYDAEKAMVYSVKSPSDFMAGVMYEQNMNMLQLQMGGMVSLTFAQDFEFPMKYYHRGRVQETKAALAKENVIQKRLDVRQKIIQAYYQLFSIQRIRELTQSKQRILQEISRIAESNYVIGRTSQSDQMKAHVEQSLAESELLMLQQEEQAVKTRLCGLLAVDVCEQSLISKDLDIPLHHLPKNISELNIEKSRSLRTQQINIEQATSERTLSKYGYAPDFRLSARTMVGESVPANNFGIGLELSIPLWFILKQNAEIKAAKAKQALAMADYELTKRELQSDVAEMFSKIHVQSALLDSYKNTLIVQTKNAFDVVQTQYKSGKGSFVELIESERSLFSLQISYYRIMADYVADIVKLETIVGVSLSSLPFEGVV